MPGSYADAQLQVWTPLFALPPLTACTGLSKANLCIVYGHFPRSQRETSTLRAICIKRMERGARQEQMFHVKHSAGSLVAGSLGGPQMASFFAIAGNCEQKQPGEISRPGVLRGARRRCVEIGTNMRPKPRNREKTCHIRGKPCAGREGAQGSGWVLGCGSRHSARRAMSRAVPRRPYASASSWPSR